MKKRIFALLLAGLLTASMTSCFQGTSDPQDTTPHQTLPETDPETDPDAPIIFTDVDETVYTLSDNVKLLTEMDSVVGAVVIKTKVTEMRRIKYHDTWSVVEYLGQQYYVLSDSLTNADLTGKNFTACADTTMYVTTDGLNIRKYASAELEKVGTLTVNDKVTVVANGGLWSKIKLVDDNGEVSYGFVKTEYLSATEYVDPNKIDFSSYFTACDPEKTMYANGSVNLRKNAHLDAEVVLVLNGNEVTVLAIGTIGEITWAKIKVEIPPEKEGDAITYKEGYANIKLLSASQGDEVVTLEDIVEHWADCGFVILPEKQTWYVSADSCNIRTSPEKIDDNLCGGAVKKDALAVVAMGTEWAVIEVSVKADDGTETVEYCFVHRSVLTPESSGTEAPFDLQALLSKNEGFTACETEGKKLYASSSVNCYVSPENSDTPATVLTAGTQVTLAATYRLGNWYIVKTADGVYYFVGAQLFSETAPQG